MGTYTPDYKVYLRLTYGTSGPFLGLRGGTFPLILTILNGDS